MGLVVYDNEPFILFKELFTPTFFIIITIIQIHFVHEDFIAFSNFDAINVDNEHETGEQFKANNTQSDFVPSKQQYQDVQIEIESKSETSPSDSSSKQTIISNDPVRRQKGSHQNIPLSPFSAYSKELPSTSKPTFCDEMKILLAKCYECSSQYYNDSIILFWRFCEIHIIKVIFLCAIVISVKDVSVMNVLFVLLTVFLMIFERFERLICFLLGIWAGVLVLLKMLFQLKTISNHINWYSNCTDFDNQSLDNTTQIDNRIYIGFVKADDIFSYISVCIFK